MIPNLRRRLTDPHRRCRRVEEELRAEVRRLEGEIAQERGAPRVRTFPTRGKVTFTGPDGVEHDQPHLAPRYPIVDAPE